MSLQESVGEYHTSIKAAWGKAGGEGTESAKRKEKRMTLPISLVELAWGLIMHPAVKAPLTEYPIRLGCAGAWGLPGAPYGQINCIASRPRVSPGMEAASPRSSFECHLAHDAIQLHCRNGLSTNGCSSRLHN
jgi:hypothetical protein